MIQVDKNLWRGPRPPDLQPLKDAGFNRIISLEQGWFEAFHSDAYEKENPSDFGITLVRIPCSDICAPHKYEVLWALDCMQRPGKTYIHCLTGVDRTGFMCAVYRMQIQKWKLYPAYAEWIALGRHWWFDWWKIEMGKYDNN